MPYNNTPNYQGIGIPTYDDMLSRLNEGQSLLGSYTNGNDIASFFGFKDKYGKFFNPVNLEGIQEGLSQIPELQSFLHGQARQEYGANKSGLMSHIGKTNIAGSGSFDSQFNKLNTDFSNKMYSSDKQIQDLVQQFQSQLNQEIGNLYGTAQGLLSGGAKSSGGFGTDDWNKGYSNPWDSLSNAYTLWNGGGE